MTQTEDNIRALVLVSRAVAEAIRDLGEVPSGHLYAMLMSTEMTLEVYQRIIGLLVEAKLVEDKAHLLRWIGPKAWGTGTSDPITGTPT